jgi:hypothetical protein
MVADELNDGGYTIQAVLKEKLGVDWNATMVKEVLWKTAQRWITQKASTTELDKSREIDVIYEHLNRHLSEKFGVYVPFPHYENEEEYVRDTIK